jgi:carboxyl-terminal processing protease
MKTFLALLLFLFVSVTQAQILTKTLSREEKILALSRLWSEAKFSFPYFDNVPSLNWDSASMAFLPKVISTTTEFETIKVLKQFGALLRDGHTAVLFPNKFYYDTLFTPAFHLKRIGRRAYVDFVPDSLRNTIPRGSEIIKIGGMDIMPFLKDSILPFVGEGTDESLWNTAIQKEMLLGIRGSWVELTFRTPANKIISKKMQRDYPFNRITELQLPEELVTFKWLNDIAYIKITSFSDKRVVSQFENTLVQLYNAKAVIMDIRDNTGGNDAYAADISKYFLAGDTIVGAKVESRYHIATYKAFARNNPKYQPFLENKAFIDLGEKKYPDTVSRRIQAPLVMLTNVSTRSASENFLVMMDHAKRGTIIGQTTGGTTGQPYFFRLVDQISVALCLPKNTYPDGKKFVGIGIKPAIEVVETYDDFLKSKDAVLEKAIHFLAKK